jgi:hypothetical protein
LRQQNKHKFATITVVVMAIFSKKQSKTNIPRRRQESAQPASERATEAELQEKYTFRRNRTITGSSSSRVSSTSESNAQFKSPRVQVHELTRQRRHIGAILTLVLGAALLLYALVSQFTAGVIVKDKDLSIQLDSTYQDIIQSYLSSQPIERLRFLANADHLSDYVQSKAPEVASIEAGDGVGFGKSSFTVTMREPIAGWSINGRQQYVDATGTSFARNYFAAPSVQIVDKSGVQVQAGQAVASSRFLGFVGRAVGLAKAQGYKVTQVIIPEGTTRQVELRLDGVGYPIKLSIDRAAGAQIEDMAKALNWLKTHGQSPQYLDVRVSGKAFYR